MQRVRAGSGTGGRLSSTASVVSAMRGSASLADTGGTSLAAEPEVTEEELVARARKASLSSPHAQHTASSLRRRTITAHQIHLRAALAKMTQMSPDVGGTAASSPLPPGHQRPFTLHFTKDKSLEQPASASPAGAQQQQQLDLSGTLQSSIGPSASVYGSAEGAGGGRDAHHGAAGASLRVDNERWGHSWGLRSARQPVTPSVLQSVAGWLAAGGTAAGPPPAALQQTATSPGEWQPTRRSTGHRRLGSTQSQGGGGEEGSPEDEEACSKQRPPVVNGGENYKKSLVWVEQRRQRLEQARGGQHQPQEKTLDEATLQAVAKERARQQRFAEKVAKRRRALARKLDEQQENLERLVASLPRGYQDRVLAACASQSAGCVGDTDAEDPPPPQPGSVEAGGSMASAASVASATRAQLRAVAAQRARQAQRVASKGASSGAGAGAGAGASSGAGKSMGSGPGAQALLAVMASPVLADAINMGSFSNVLASSLGGDFADTGGGGSGSGVGNGDGAMPEEGLESPPKARRPKAVKMDLVNQKSFQAFVERQKAARERKAVRLLHHQQQVL